MASKRKPAPTPGTILSLGPEWLFRQPPGGGNLLLNQLYFANTLAIRKLAYLVSKL
jgi:hypothetical protein